MDYYPTLVRMFDSRRLLKCLHVLVTAPCTAVEDTVFASVRDLLLHLMATQRGEEGGLMSCDLIMIDINPLNEKNEHMHTCTCVSSLISFKKEQ